MGMVLLINCCVRKCSRTLRLAKEVLVALGNEYEEVRVSELGLLPLTEEDIENRARLVEEGCLDAPELALAKQFAKAETIVIAAPYWDLGFPSSLKLYLERIYVIGIVSQYDENGTPHGLCKGKKLYYVTTSGGTHDPRFGYDYVRELTTRYFGIRETKLVAAEMLDVDGFDAEAQLKKASDGFVP